MNNLDVGRYGKRFVQLFWDPEPKNEAASNSTIWCLGVNYRAASSADSSEPTNSTSPATTTNHDSPQNADLPHQSRPMPETNESFVKIERPEDAPSSTNGTSTTIPPSIIHDIATLASSNAAEGWPPAFLDDFESRIWLTYRSDFPPIAKSSDPSASSRMSLAVRLKSQLASPTGFTSDTGWGCMIRSGQSILANALALLHLGRSWRRPIDTSSAPDAAADLEEKRLLSLFADHPSAPFSIHNFVSHGASACGTHPGQWFGPSATAACIQALASAHTASNLRVYVPGDGPDIYADSLLHVAKRGGDTFLPTLLLVGTRLGIDRVTPVYRDALAAALKMPQAVGIAGGRPSSSHYFVGVQDATSFFYLDPHTPRPALPHYEDPAQYTAADVATCHTRRLRRIGVEEMDPSMLIAFLFRNEEEWESWRKEVREAPGKAIFHVLESEGKKGGGSGEGTGSGRPGAVDEVETFDDEDDESALE